MYSSLYLNIQESINGPSVWNLRHKATLLSLFLPSPSPFNGHSQGHPFKGRPHPAAVVPWGASKPTILSRIDMKLKEQVRLAASFLLPTNFCRSSFDLLLSWQTDDEIYENIYNDGSFLSGFAYLFYAGRRSWKKKCIKSVGQKSIYTNNNHVDVHLCEVDKEKRLQTQQIMFCSDKNM